MQLTDKLDIKVFILFLLKNIKEPLEYSMINDIVVQDGYVNYFDFSICFAELLECGQIDEIEGEKTMYRISPLGEEAVGNVEMRLFKSVREKALRSAMRLLAFYRNGTVIDSDITEENNGYVLHCSIHAGDKPLLELKTYLTEKYYTETLQQNFNDKAEYIYKSILALLSGDVNFIFDE